MAVNYDETLEEEIAKQDNTLPARPEGFGITIREYSENPKHQMSPDAARKFLNGLVDAGALQMVKMKAKTGAPTNVYCRLGDWPPKKKAVVK